MVQSSKSASWNDHREACFTAHMHPDHYQMLQDAAGMEALFFTERHVKLYVNKTWLCAPGSGQIRAGSGKGCQDQA